MKSIYAEILSAIDAAQSVILISHKQPDGDTAGSALALAHYIEMLGKRYTLYCTDPVGPYLEFLPKAKEIGPHDDIWEAADFDLVIVVDTGDLRHAKVDDKIASLTHNYTLINIDHHHTNSNYGDINLVDAEASSACEIVYHVLDSRRAITKDIANCLLTGLTTDTGSFSNLATTASAVQIASKLLSYGASLPQISRNTLHYRPLNTLNLWGRALQRLHEDPETGMIVTALTMKDLEECGADGDATSGISNFLNELEQAADKAIMVLTQSEPGLIKGSIRTTNPLIDVSEFAKLYGGGGHKKAAGFTTEGILEITPHGYTITPTNN